MNPTYLAGPMRGYPQFNFPAFDKAEEDLRERGYEVINPARLDKEAGFDPIKKKYQKREVEELLYDAQMRDIKAIMTNAQSLTLLPGWGKSVGAMAEYHLARWRRLPVLLYPSMSLFEDEDILEEALRLTSGDRQNQYGPPDQDFRRTAEMWSALKGVEFTPQDVALFMICLKCSRETHQKKRDNWTDIAGYARCGWICNQSEKKG